MADAKMNRTKARPIPSGRVTRGAMRSGSRFFLSIAGFAELWLGANLLTGAARAVHAGELSVLLYAAEAAVAGIDHHRRDPRRDAAADRLRRRRRHADRGTRGCFTRSCSCGSFRIFTRSPGCIAKITRAPESACCRWSSRMANPPRAACLVFAAADPDQPAAAIPGHGGKRFIWPARSALGADVRCMSACAVWSDRTTVRARARCCWRAWSIFRFFMASWCWIALDLSLAAARRLRGAARRCRGYGAFPISL